MPKFRESFLPRTEADDLGKCRRFLISIDIQARGEPNVDPDAEP
jgi:hypothetical protein